MCVGTRVRSTWSVAVVDEFKPSLLVDPHSNDDDGDGGGGGGCVVEVINSRSPSISTRPLWGCHISAGGRRRTRNPLRGVCILAFERETNIREICSHIAPAV